jgi:hypothetical protein
MTHYPDQHHDTKTTLPPSSHAKPVDTFAPATELEAELKRVIRGDVRFDRGTRAMYASDGSNYRQAPIGVVVPKDNADVVAALATCRKYGAPVLSRGAGTSLAGQCCNVAVVLDYTQYMNRILELNPADKYAWVQPGVVCDSLRDAAELHAHLGTRPIDTQPLLTRRHDRQQLLRHTPARWQGCRPFKSSRFCSTTEPR